MPQIKEQTTPNQKVEEAIEGALQKCYLKFKQLSPDEHELPFLAVWHLFFWEELKKNLLGNKIKLTVETYHLDKSPIVSFEPSKDLEKKLEEAGEKGCNCELADILYTFNFQSSLRNKNKPKRKAYFTQVKRSKSTEEDPSSLKQNELTKNWPLFKLSKPLFIAKKYTTNIEFKKELMPVGYGKLIINVNGNLKDKLKYENGLSFSDFIYSAIRNEPDFCRPFFRRTTTPRKRKINRHFNPHHYMVDDWDWLITLLSREVRANKKYKFRNSQVLKNGKLEHRGKELELGFIAALLSTDINSIEFIENFKFLYYDITIEEV